MSDTSTLARETPGQPDIEAVAREMGWRPKDEFSGPAEQWKPAEDFVKRGTEILPIVRENNRRLMREVETLKTQVAEARDSNRYVTELMRSSETRAYERAKRELLAERETAVAAGDTAAFNRTQAEIDALKPPPAPPAPATRQAPDAGNPHPDAVAWVKQNDWFNKDPVLNAAAIQLHVSLRASEPDLSVADNLERVSRAVRSMYPERVPKPATNGHLDAGAATETDDAPAAANPRRTAAAAVTGSTGMGAASRANQPSFDKLPQESKEAFKKYERLFDGKGKPLTKEEWTKEAWPLYFS